MNVTCANIHLPIPPVPHTANQSSSFDLSSYKPASGGLTQILSTALAQSTFSANNVHTLLDRLVSNDRSSWTTSEITKFNPVLSVIIYASVTLALFLIFAIIFCVVSCRSSYKVGRKRTSKCSQVCVCLLIIVYLLGIGDMAYVVYRINRSRVSIDETIRQVNEEIYPKEISEHVIYLNKQLNQLDQYCTQPQSILINASKSIFLRTFDQVLNDQYFIDALFQSINRTGERLQELTTTIERHTGLLPAVKDSLKEFQESYDSMMGEVQIPIEEVCLYANGSKTEIDQKLVDALNVVHTQLSEVNETIRRDILSSLTPWEEKKLLSTATEKQVRNYANLAGILSMVLVIVLGVIPVIFLLFVLASRFCGCNEVDSDGDDAPVPMRELNTNAFDAGAHRKPTNRVAPAHHHRKRNRSHSANPYRVPLCLMRFAFSLMVLILIVLTLVTAVCYALDLAVHAGCRTIRDDRPYLINLLASRNNDSIVIFGNQTALNTTVSGLLDDCRNGAHFSEKLLRNYWSILHKDMSDMITSLNGQVFNQFIQAIGNINVPQDMKLLKNLVELANQTDISVVIVKIEKELENMNGYFANISASKGTLPSALVQSTIMQFEDYLKDVLNSTLDGCPLPVTTISKADTLVCQTLGSSVNGLWLSMLIFMLLTTLGLSICGLCVYKRVSSIPTTNRF